MENNTNRLLFTLCKEGSTSYRYATVPIPESYAAAVKEAKRVFPDISTSGSFFQSKSNTITLKLGTKRANGTGTWSSIQSHNWGTVVGPNDEIGVFAGQESKSFDMPYEPQPKVLPGGNTTPPPYLDDGGDKVLLYMTYNDKTVKGNTQPSAVIVAPLTFEDCQAEALRAFYEYLNQHEATDILLECENNYSEWAIVSPGAYSTLLAGSLGEAMVRVSVSRNPAVYTSGRD
ncbi:hypothetical protein CPB83DRAFT_851673 [Crepidotus variabilis]|uniref:Uncharacterized protein n=1 Tax=Crepidotus variabilis TaxID=179855 RepID=A0A9P6EJ50_9AGAR|nr:hypothetical protein CPB83DRAFT_851673 [Crepidotus variabilis]